MTIVAFIGSGHIGSTVARLSVAAGHQVVLSNSRGPATLAGLAIELGPLARAATAEEAAAAGEIVVVSIPLRAYQSVPAEPLVGKVVLDTCNYYPERDGHFAALDDGVETSSELLQSHLAGAQVVKVFNNLFYKHLLSLSRPPGVLLTAASCPSRAMTRTLRPGRPNTSTPSATAQSTPATWPTAGGRSRARRWLERLMDRSPTRPAPLRQRQPFAMPCQGPAASGRSMQPRLRRRP